MSQMSNSLPLLHQSSWSHYLTLTDITSSNTTSVEVGMESRKNHHQWTNLKHGNLLGETPVVDTKLGMIVSKTDLDTNKKESGMSQTVQ